MRIPVDRSSAEPLYRQIQHFVQRQIEAGTMEPGTRLPATRELATTLGVGRVTVTNAYAELEAEGLVSTRTGSGTYVSPPADLTPSRQRGLGAHDWPLWQQNLLSRSWKPASVLVQEAMAKIDHPDLISFSVGLGAMDLFPADEFRRTLQAVLRQDGCEAFGYAHWAGHPPLRRTIAQILTDQGVPTHPEEVLVTSGSQQAIALVGQLLLRPGDVVMVESPTYSGAIDLFRFLEVRILGVPMDSEGMLMDKAEEAVRTANPRLIYTIPNFHNPTGVCMSGIRRRQLMAMSARYNVPILEDDCFGDLRFEGRAQPALKALDPGGHVIYVNTFSKMLMPGLRVGFLVASGPAYGRLVACKRATDLATCTPIQRGLDAYITVGRYRSHLRRACRVYRERRDAMLVSLARYMPKGVRWVKPEGGLFLWVQLPAGVSAEELLPIAGEEGVTFAPGSLFFPGERAQPFLRLSFAYNPPELNDEGIRRLARGLRRHMSAPREARQPRELAKEMA